MDYTTDDRRFSELVKHQLELTPGSISICPGNGATSARPAVGQIHLAREAGAPGFAIFD